MQTTSSRSFSTESARSCLSLVALNSRLKRRMAGIPLAGMGMQPWIGEHSWAA